MGGALVVLAGRSTAARALGSFSLKATTGFVSPPTIRHHPGYPARARRGVCVNVLGDFMKKTGEMFGGAANPMEAMQKKMMEQLAPEELKELDVEGVEQSLKDGNMNFDDFLKQMKLFDKMASMAEMAQKIPGMGDKINPDQFQQAGDRLKSYEAMMVPMTPEERANPELFLPTAKGVKTRLQRIADESGKSLTDVQGFVGEFFMMRQVMTRVANGEDMATVQKDVKKQAMAMAQGKWKPKKESEKKKLKKKAAKNKKSGSGGGGFGSA
uniref:Signal recognition particle SRP54 subunit M-domain domain-containing protein n=1 Tax=Lotharella oceanica TaxID=641309 RepID=A0A7S2TV07_9EUKA